MSLQGMSKANDEAIHNLVKSKSNYGIFTSEIPHYRLPRKFFKFSRNDRKLTTASLQTLYPYCPCAHPRTRESKGFGDFKVQEPNRHNSDSKEIFDKILFCSYLALLLILIFANQLCAYKKVEQQ